MSEGVDNRLQRIEANQKSLADGQARIEGLLEGLMNALADSEAKEPDKLAAAFARLREERKAARRTV